MHDKMNTDSAEHQSIPLFWSAPYQTSILAKITKQRNNEVQFDQMLFYPGGGGQPSDIGKMVMDETEYEIVEVFKDEEGIWHKLDVEEISLEIYKQVLLKLDWERRYALMRAHTAQHLFSHMIQKKYGIKTLKANFAPETIDIEIDKVLPIEEIIETLEEVHYVSENGADVTSIVIDQKTYEKEYKAKTRGKVSDEEPIRLIQLGDFDLVACGGVHIKNLKEIDGVFLESIKDTKIKLLTKTKGINYANQQRRLMIQLEDITKKKGQKLVKMLANKVQENESLKEGIETLLKLLFTKSESYAEKIKNHTVTIFNLPTIERKHIQTTLKEIPENYLTIIKGKDAILYVISKIEGVKANEIVKIITERYDAKGGGNKGFAQVNGANVENPLEVIKQIILEL